MVGLRSKGNSVRKHGFVDRVRHLRGGTAWSMEGGAAQAPRREEPGGVRKPNAMSILRAMMFYAVTLTASVPLFCTMVVGTPFVMAMDRHRRRFMHMANSIWAFLSRALFYRVEVEGKANLPEPYESTVYVANHSSWLDIFSLFALWRPFKFISKSSIFLIPIIGWAMFLTGHISLRRSDRRSQVEVLDRCRSALRHGNRYCFDWCCSPLFCCSLLGC